MSRQQVNQTDHAAVSAPAEHVGMDKASGPAHKAPPTKAPPTKAPSAESAPAKAPQLKSQPKAPPLKAPPMSSPAKAHQPDAQAPAESALATTPQPKTHAQAPATNPDHSAESALVKAPPADPVQPQMFDLADDLTDAEVYARIARGGPPTDRNVMTYDEIYAAIARSRERRMREP